MITEENINKIKNAIFDIVIEQLKEPINNISDVYNGAIFSTIGKLIDDITIEKIKEKLRKTTLF